MLVQEPPAAAPPSPAASGGVAIPQSADPVAGAARTQRSTWPARARDGALLAALVGLAALIRYQNLWLLPRLTDEWREVSKGLLIAQEGRLPLTNYDAYIGA